MIRTQLYSDPNGRFLHDLILDSCRHFPTRTAFVDTSLPEPRRISFGEYGEMVENVARGLLARGLERGDVVAINLTNSWEYCAAYHATTLAGGIPSPMNPSYREREIRYQLENSGAAMFVTDGPQLTSVNLDGIPTLRKVFYTRDRGSIAKGEPFSDLLQPSAAALPRPTGSPEEILAALPYSSGTTGLPKGVMLTHYNLVANIFQILDASPIIDGEVILAFLPLYHIYGLNVVMNTILARGGTLVLMPRFDLEGALQWIVREPVTMMAVVPPIMNVMAQAAEQGRFPKNHRVRFTKVGAAPLAPELPRKFTELTGIKVVQGYGMTEASPVTHTGFIDGPLSRPDSIGIPVSQTECRIIPVEGTAEDAEDGQVGELVMRGPQFMVGYWKSPEATAQVLRRLPVAQAAAANATVTISESGPTQDGTSSSGSSGTDRPWYFSGDVVRVDADGLYYVVDRQKEMIKYKGFPIAPAEVEAALLENDRVRDCGVVGQFDDAAGEVPIAFVVLRDGFQASRGMQQEISAWLADRITRYKQPREIRFIDSIPRNPSGKILRRELRKIL